MSCFVLDYNALERFFRSCAVTICMQQSIQIKWVEYKDSAVLNAAYTLMFWKEGPGTVEVDIKTASEMEDRVEELTDRYVQSFFRKLHDHGFNAASQYAASMYDVKLGARDAINEAFRSAQEINDEIIGKTSEAIKNAARVKLAAGVGVAIISGGAGVLAVAGAGGAIMGASPLVFTAVGVGNSVTHSVIKTWENGGMAKAVAVDFGKTAMTESAGKAAEVLGGKTAANLAKKSMARQNAEVAVARFSNLLGRKSTTAKNVGKRTDKLLGAQKTLNTATSSARGAGVANAAARGLGYALPVAFATLDILNEIEDYKKTVGAL